MPDPTELTNEQLVRLMTWPDGILTSLTAALDAIEKGGA